MTPRLLSFLAYHPHSASKGCGLSQEFQQAHTTTHKSVRRQPETEANSKRKTLAGISSAWRAHIMRFALFWGRLCTGGPGCGRSADTPNSRRLHEILGFEPSQFFSSRGVSFPWTKGESPNLSIRGSHARSCRMDWPYEPGRGRRPSRRRPAGAGASPPRGAEPQGLDARHGMACMIRGEESHTQL